MGQGRLYWHHWAPWVPWRASLQQWGWVTISELCTTTLHSLYFPGSCTRLPTSTQPCATRKTPGWHSRDRSTVCYYWHREEKGQTRMMPYITLAWGLQWEGGMDGWCWWASILLFFFFPKTPDRYEMIRNKTYGTKLLELPNLSLRPCLYIWEHVLSDSATETPTDKAWGVTGDKQWPPEASGAAQSRNSSLRFRQLCNFCPCQLSQAKSCPGCMKCAGQHCRGAMSEITGNRRPCCFFTLCTLHFYSGDNTLFFKMSANEVRNRFCMLDLQRQLLFQQTWICLRK